MTFSVLEDHSPIASLYKCDISYLWRVLPSLCICKASCRMRADRQTDRQTSRHYHHNTSPQNVPECG